MLAVCAQPRGWEWFRPRRPRPPRPPRNPWPWALLLVLALELFALPLRRPRVVEAPAEVAGALLITTDMGERPVRRVLPPPGKGDPSWQKGDAECRPPYEAVHGYCWAGLDREKFRPPCPGGLYEHQGRCLAPVVKGKRPDTSIQR